MFRLTNVKEKNNKMSLKEGPDRSISVPDKRQSGIERPGSVGPSAFASRVSQGGLSYIRWSGSFVPESVPSNGLFSSISFGESRQCCVASFSAAKVKRRGGIPFRNLNFIDKCPSHFASSMKLLYC